MSNEIDLNKHHVAGDSLTIIHTVVSDDIVDLTGVSARWWLLENEPAEPRTDAELDGDAILSDADSGVSVQVNEADSEIVVEFDEGATGDQAGYFYQVLRAEGTQGRNTWGGDFLIRSP
jgi:hypothetical protein